MTVEEYEAGGAAGWRGCVRDDAGRWILWVGLDGSASLYRKDGDACEHVASVPEKPME